MNNNNKSNLSIISDNHPELRSLNDVTTAVLEETRLSTIECSSVRISLSELGSLSNGLITLAPLLKSVNVPIDGSSEVLYRASNLKPTDKLLQAKDGTFWGSIVKADGTKGFVKFKEVKAASFSGLKPVFDPTSLMIAATLVVIQQQLSTIQEIQENILSFLQFESESEIEADVETLSSITSKFKHNWDNKNFLSSNHKMVLDIQRTARKHILLNRKLIEQLMTKQKGLVNSSKVHAAYKEFERTFKYYRLALYSYSLSSMMEIMLSENYSEGHISEVIEELNTQSNDYRSLFTDCSMFLESVSKSNMDINVLNVFGSISNFTGKVIASIPFVNETEIDEQLISSGDKMFDKATEMKELHVQDFSVLGNPSNSIFIDKLNEFSIINNSDTILFDEEFIYLNNSNTQ